jgi:hypothetical protein
VADLKKQSQFAVGKAKVESQKAKVKKQSQFAGHKNECKASVRRCLRQYALPGKSRKTKPISRFPGPWREIVSSEAGLAANGLFVQTCRL